MFILEVEYDFELFLLMRRLFTYRELGSKSETPFWKYVVHMEHSVEVEEKALEPSQKRQILQGLDGLGIGIRPTAILNTIASPQDVQSLVQSHLGTEKIHQIATA